MDLPYDSEVSHLQMCELGNFSIHLTLNNLKNGEYSCTQSTCIHKIVIIQ